MHETKRLAWRAVYREAELYKSAVRLYTKPLFNARKGFSRSVDGNTIYDFARHGLKQLDALHRALAGRRFAFREALLLKRNFNGRQRSLYVFPWEERLVMLLLYRLLNRSLDQRFSRSSYAYRCRGFGVDRCQREIKQALMQDGGPVYVVKRDIADFFASIDHAVLLDKIAALVDTDDYLFALLAACVKFSYRDDAHMVSADRGVPFGTAVACLFANIYLMQLDRRLEEVAGIRFFRYADDLLVLSPTAAKAERAAEIFESEMNVLRLASKPSHESSFILAEPIDGKAECRQFETRRKFRHLGLEYRADRSVGLSRDKFRKIRNLFRFALRRNAKRIGQRHSPESRAKLAVEIIEKTLHRGVRNVAIIDYYLRHVTDQRQLQQLDRWLAEEVLSLAFGGGHKKGYFRRLPFRKLRQMGLPSLVHRRRLILHGGIESPFFIWRSHREQQECGGKAARPKSAVASAFSQCPEAAAR